MEDLARLVSVRQPLRYATSFYGVIDLRILRLLRVFRVFRLTAYMTEFTPLGRALHASRRKILVFLSFVLMVVLVVLAVPTGIVTAEMTAQRHCAACGADEHAEHASYCWQCGAELTSPQ